MPARARTEQGNTKQAAGPKPLTAVAVRNAKPGNTRREVPDAGCAGLYLIVQPTGAKSWAVRYRAAGGQPRKLTLGPALEQDMTGLPTPAFDNALTLAAARKLATEALFEVKQGKDPAAAKKRAKTEARQKAPTRDEDATLRTITDQFFRREGKNLRSSKERRATFDRLILPALGDRLVVEIKRSEITSLLDDIEEGRGPVMADAALAALRRLLNWFASRSDDFRSPIVRGMARTKPRERARERVLTDDELRVIWRTADADIGPFGPMVQFILLTATRRNEAADMTPAEVTGTDWTIPAARYKGKRDHVVPLSGGAQQVLQRVLRDGGEYVFTTGKRRIGHALGDGLERPISGFSKFKRKFDKACGVTGWGLHDLRRTARSLMSRAGVPSDHAERCLGHVIGGVRGIYDRHEFYEEKRSGFDLLARQIERIVRAEPLGANE